MAFKFNIRDTVAIKVSAEQGRVIGRADYELSQNGYLIRYKAADGKATEAWWPEDSLSLIGASTPPAPPAVEEPNEPAEDAGSGGGDA